MPEVGISGLPLDYPHSGSAVYVRNLVRELPAAAPDLAFFLFTRWSQGQEGAHGRRVSSPFASLRLGRPIVARADKLTWEVGSLPAASIMRGQALLHSTYFAAPFAASCPVVVTVHDVIPLVLPGYHRGRSAAWYSRLMAWNVPRAARSLITVSEHAKRDIMRVLGVPEHRVHVTYEAVEDRFHPDQVPGTLEAVRAKYRLPERFALYLGGAERRKNVETLVRAWSRAARSLADRELTLVIVAKFPPADALYPDIPGLVRSLGLEHAVRFVSDVDEADKPGLYASALLFCFPSLYEGFGFPPLEAMASGVPVLSSTASSLPEILGDAAYALPAQDIAAWADALVHVADATALRDDLRTRGLARSRQFTWRRTAEQTASIYRTILGV